MKKIIRKTVGAADRIGPILGVILALIGIMMASSAITPGPDAVQTTTKDRQASAIPAIKLSGTRAAQVSSLANSRIAAGSQNDMPSQATLTTDRQDYPPYSFVHISGAGFEPGETVNLIAVELEPEPAAFEPWDAVADENGNFETSWYIFTEDLYGATLQVTATGQSSGLTASAIFTDAVGPGIAPNGDPGGFEVQGNVLATAGGGHTDWVANGAGTTGLLTSGGVPINSAVTYRRLDPYTSGDDVFVSGSKVKDNPSTYTWNTGSANNKDDINNAYVHISQSADSHRWVTASADRLSTNGSSYIDFELNQAALIKVTDTGCSNPPCGHFETNPAGKVSGDPLFASGGRTNGDLLVSASYSGNGSSTLSVSQWKQVSGTWQWADISSSIPANKAFVETTQADGQSVPYGAFGGTTYSKGQFVEMSLDLDALLGAVGDPCAGIQVRTVFVKTKTAESDSANIVDFTEPISVSFSAGFTVTGSQMDPTCSSDTGTVTATFSGGTAPYMCKLDTASFAPCTSQQSYSVASGTSHVITVKDNNACTKDTGTIMVATGDVTNPTIGAPGANQTIECPATPSFTAPTASDNSGSVTVQQVGDTTAAGTCSNNYSRTVSWQAIDGCGNTSATVNQTIIVRDTTAPTIGNAGADATIECTATPSFTAPTASDACGGSSIVLDSDTTAAGSCANNFTRTRTWHAADACGNTSASRSQTITVRDTTAPVLGDPGANATTECTVTPSFTAPTASDVCGGSTVVQDSDTTQAGTCANNYTRTVTWHAVDACGNTSAQKSQIITVRDTTAPTIGNAGADATIECTATPSFTAPTASDTCGGSSIVLDSDTTAAGSCANNFTRTRTWHAVDACGNTSATRSQTITVRDTTAPLLGDPGANATIECTATPSFTAPTASDACGGSTVVQDSDTTQAGTCANNYTRTVTWHAVDACGNTSAQKSQIITVHDTTAPTIGNAGAGATIECTATPSFTAPTASDTCGGSSIVLDSDTTAAGSCANNFTRTRTWHAVDACGNTSATRSQTITVRDSTAPTIGNAGADATIECTDTPSFTAPTASDTCGGSSIVLDSDTTAAGSCANNFTRTRTWHAVDVCGNTSASRSQTITVRDTTAPIIGNAGADATIECTDTPSFTAPTASDACGGSSIVLDSDTTAAGSCANNFTRTRTWHAVDACGNTSATRSQTITVRDTTAPTIGNAGADATIECTATPSFTAPTASDTCGGSSIVLDSDTTAAGSCANNFTRTRTWHAVDACGNTSATRSQTITVRDTTAPVLGDPGANATTECTATPSFTAPTASDACGGSTVVQDSDTTQAGTCANNYTRTVTWHAVDACGNTSAQKSQIITVRDTTAPTIGNAGADATIECTATPSFTAPTASDTCGGSSIVLDSDTTAAGSCANNFTRTRTWHAVDTCGNTSATRSQTITVRDTTAPVLGDPGANGTIECTATPSFTAPTASDACGGSTVVQDSDTTQAGTCANNYTRTVTWHAVDACGNTSAQKSQTITVRDTIAPMIGTAGSDATIECTATPTFTAPTISDACGGSSVVLDSDTTAAGSCANNFTRTRTWHAVDACGNTSATRSQTITVRDTTAPTIGGQGADYILACGSSPSFVPPTASDACGGSSVNEISDTTTAGAHNSVIRTKTWRASDACGNTSATVSQSVTIRASITVTANDRVKTFGTVLNLGTTEFMVSGNLGAGESITNVTLTSVTGKAGAINAPVGVYPNEIEPSNATGSGGFVASNYCINYVKGQLTIVPPVFTTVPSNLTNSSLMCFDTDTNLPGRQFNLIYIQGASGYVLNASNPGQFYDNVLYVDPDPSHVGNMVTVKVYVPYPFVTQGAQPVHVYDFVAASGNFPCINFTPGADVSSNFTITTQGGTPSPSGAQTIVLGDYGTSPVTGLTETFVTVTGPLPANGLIYVNVHLDYGLKRTNNWTRTGTNAVDATNATPTPYPSPTPSGSLLVRGASSPSYPSGQPYHLHAEGNGVPLCTPTNVCEDIAYSVNVFKKSVGVAGTVSDLLSNPIPNATVKLYGPNSMTTLVASALTDNDGTYYLNYKHTGREATFYVKLSCTSGDLVQTVSLKANDFRIVNFSNVTCSQMLGPGNNPTAAAKPKPMKEGRN